MAVLVRLLGPKLPLDMILLVLLLVVPIVQERTKKRTIVLSRLLAFLGSRRYATLTKRQLSSYMAVSTKGEKICFENSIVVKRIVYVKGG